jgi:transcriptional regulator GlxA family with amidase domain
VRAFRRRFGCSIGAYVRRLRLARAVQDVIESDKPPAAVALDAGFADQCHLTRMMKSHLGTTPAVLRHSHRATDAGMVKLVSEPQPRSGCLRATR